MSTSYELYILLEVPVTLFFLQFWSESDEIWHEGGPWDPNNRKNTEVWLPRYFFFIILQQEAGLPPSGKVRENQGKF